MRTYTSAIEHEVSCFAISEAPENGCSTEEDDSEENVEDLNGPFCQYRVIQGGSP